MGILAPGSAHAWPSAQPPINTNIFQTISRKSFNILSESEYMSKVPHPYLGPTAKPSGIIPLLFYKSELCPWPASTISRSSSTPSWGWSSWPSPPGTITRSSSTPCQGLSSWPSPPGTLSPCPSVPSPPLCICYPFQPIWVYMICS